MWYVSWIIMFLLHQKHEVLQKKGKNTFIPGGGCWFLSQRKMEDLHGQCLVILKGRMNVVEHGI
jgi:hypothetical protein